MWLQWLALEHGFCFLPGRATGLSTIFNPITKRFVVEKDENYEGFSSATMRIKKLNEDEVEDYLKG